MSYNIARAVRLTGLCNIGVHTYREEDEFKRVVVASVDGYPLVTNEASIQTALPAETTKELEGDENFVGIITKSGVKVICPTSGDAYPLKELIQRLSKGFRGRVADLEKDKGIADEVTS